MSAIRKWFEDRTGMSTLIKFALDEPVHGGAKWSYIFGSGLIFLFILQAVTGIIMTAYYSPSATDAWGSVYYLQHKTSFGWFVRGIHHFGSSAMMILAIVHLFQVFIFGAYKKPRELNWISGVILLMVIAGFGLTGYLLPWDQKGYWATQVATNIMGTIPVIGKYIKSIHLGGSDYGNFTITRFYTLHVFLLPISLLSFVFVHLALFRKHGVTPYWKMREETIHNCVDPFWPDQVFKDIVFAIGMYAALAGWVFWQGGAELQAPADPASNYLARPEWYFLFLFQLLKYCQGPFLIVGTVIVPALAIAFLFALPFIDRNPSKWPSKRIPFFCGVFSGLAGVVALTILAMHHDSQDIHIIHQHEEAEIQAALAVKLAAKGIAPSGGLSIFENDPLILGKKVYESNCRVCHKVQGEGGDTGPDFTGFGSREWVAGLLKNPKDARYFKEPALMPPISLPDDTLLNMSEFILSQSGGLLNPNVERVAKGQELVLNGNCVICHAIGDKELKMLGPNLTAYLSKGWLKEFIRNPAAPKFYGTRNKMPQFDKLTDKEMDALIQYLFSLSKDRLIVSERQEYVKEKLICFWTTQHKDIDRFWRQILSKG
ncbi:MAG: cytochrome b N-terminal domain-containing protein [Planctomycetota bacterium]